VLETPAPSAFPRWPAVRYATPDGGATVDVLDAARRLVPLDDRHVDRITSQGFLASGEHMAGLARVVARAAGEESHAVDLLAGTEALARRCRLDPGADVGLNTVHFPEASVLDLAAGQSLDARLRERCAGGVTRCYPGAGARERRTIEHRLDAELTAIASSATPYFLTAAIVRADPRPGHPGRRPRLGAGTGQPPAGDLRRGPARHNLLMERFLTPLRARLPDIDIDVESARAPRSEAILTAFGAGE
jgi:error-prone DNA polymerase